jgi:homoserine acetyltransferase
LTPAGQAVQGGHDSAGQDPGRGVETGGGTWRFPANRPLRLDSGAKLAPLEIAYKTYGR